MNELANVKTNIPKSPVYVLPDDQGRITRCEGGYTIRNCQVSVDTGEVDDWGRPITETKIADGWVKIDEGYGDKYNLCQSHYFDGGVYTFDGIPRYKLVDGQAVERSEEEMDADRVPSPDPGPTLENRVETLEADSAETREALDMLLSGVTSDE